MNPGFRKVAFLACGDLKVAFLNREYMKVAFLNLGAGRKRAGVPGSGHRAVTGGDLA